MHDVIVIGSGPAGLTAAIYTSRARLKTLLIAGAQWGGQLMLTGDVENFPGFRRAVRGPDLITNMLSQAESSGAEVVFDDATSVDFSSRPFKVLAGGRTYEGRAVIVATGASRKLLGIKGERGLMGKGVSLCALCDGPLFKDKRVLVVGGGDTALEEALELSKFASEVKVVHRRDRLRATRILQERAFKEPKIEFVWNCEVEEVLGAGRVEGVRLRRVDSGERFELACDGVFIAIGQSPNTEIFRGQLELDGEGYVVARDFTRTSVDGVFVAGEAQDRSYRQAVFEAGMGCKAAIDAARYLERLGG